MSATTSAQVIQSNTVQNHQAEAVIRKYNTSTECTSLEVLIKIQYVSRSTAYNTQISHIHDICLLIQESIQTRINTTYRTWKINTDQMSSVISSVTRAPTTHAL